MNVHIITQPIQHMHTETSLLIRIPPILESIVRIIAVTPETLNGKKTAHVNMAYQCIFVLIA